ncbi:MAG: hypothetical protein HY645_13875 [Acidobacteria bacterium]|nr:hypothetical protein [Acidobacteriota bacterium]
MRRCSDIIGLIGFFFILTVPTLAQSKAQVDLGTAIARLGEIMSVPITVDTKGERIQATESELELPPQVTFVQAEAAAGSSAKVDARVDAASQGRKVTIKVEAGDGKQLPDGIIAQVKFRVSEPETPTDYKDILIQNRAGVFAAGGQKQTAEGKPGTLIVMREIPVPQIACFFYMH